MESIKISLDILIPIFLMILSGVVLRRTNVIDGPSVRKMNAAAFKFFLPVMMFYNVYESSVSILKWDFLVFIILAVTAAFGLAFLLVPVFEKERSRRGVIIQGAVRSNFAVYGYAVASAFCSGDESGLAALMAAVVLPLYGIYSTVALAVYGEEEKGINIKKILLNIAKNPLVISGVLGVITLISGLRFPAVIESTMNSVAKAATPVSLIALGGFLNFGIFKGKKKSIAIGTIGKLILVPAVFITAAVLLGFKGAELAVCTAVFASPTATASFAMTQQMSGDDELAAALVVTSCAGSFFTMFIIISILQGIGLL